MVNKKEDNLLHTQGMYYEFDGIKFKSKEELEAYQNGKLTGDVDFQAYQKLRKNSEEEISEEKAVEDTKAESHKVKVVEMTDEAVEKLKASIEAKKAKAKEKVETDRVAKEKAEVDKVAKEKVEADRVAQEKAAVRVAQEKADAIAKEKAKSSRENIGDIKSDEINRRKATKFWWLA